MALGNDLDAKIDVIYNEYLNKQSDEKLANRVLTSKDSFKEGLEEVIKINNIVDKSVFFDAILVEIKNGNFSISNDGKIDLNSESVNKAVLIAKEEEQKDREVRNVVEAEIKNDKLDAYKDLLEIKEVKSLEDAKRIVSMDVPNEIFDQIDPEVKRAAFQNIYEQTMDSERAAAMADIAVDPPKVDSYIDEAESDKIFRDKSHSKAFVGFYNTCFDDIDLIKKYAEGCEGLDGYDWNDPEQKKVGLAIIFTALQIAHEKKGMGDSFLEEYTKLSELTEEQRVAYKKLEPLYTRTDNIHDARLVTTILEQLEGAEWTKEQLRDSLRSIVEESKDWELTPEIEAAIQEIVDNQEIFKEVAAKTVERKKQENIIDKFVYNVTPKEFSDVYDRYLFGYDKNAVLDRDYTFMGVDNGIRLNEMYGEARKDVIPGDIKGFIKYGRMELSEIIHNAQKQIHGPSVIKDEIPPVQQEGDEMDDDFVPPISDGAMAFTFQTKGEDMVVGDARVIGGKDSYQVFDLTKGGIIVDKGSQIVYTNNLFAEEEFTEEGINHKGLTGKDKTKVMQEETNSSVVQVEDIAVDEATVNTMSNANLPKKITWVDKVRASVDAFGKNVKKAFGSFISAITGKGGENNSEANNAATSTSSNAGQNKPVQEVNNFVPTVELNLKQAQQATKAAEEAKKNNEARGTDEPIQDDSEIGE